MKERGEKEEGCREVERKGINTWSTIRSSNIEQSSNRAARERAEETIATLRSTPDLSVMFFIIGTSSEAPGGVVKWWRSNRRSGIGVDRRVVKWQNSEIVELVRD